MPRQNKFPYYFSFGTLILISFIIIDHNRIHNNNPFQVEDLIFAVNGLSKSHEGIILFISIVAIAIILGDHFYKKIK